MACHNERVARSRKHAEAKRNKGQRKEEKARLGNGSSTTSSRNRPGETDRDGRSSTLITPMSDNRRSNETFPVNVSEEIGGTVDSSNSSPRRTPRLHSPVVSSAPHYSPDLPTQSPSTDRYRIDSPSLTNTSSVSSIPVLVNNQPRSHPQQQQQQSSQPSRSETSSTSTGKNPPNHLPRGLGIESRRDAIAPTFPLLSPSTTPTFADQQQQRHQSRPTSNPPASTPMVTGGSASSLTAPPLTQKSINRRSGFYGGAVAEKTGTEGDHQRGNAAETSSIEGGRRSDDSDRRSNSLPSPPLDEIASNQRMEKKSFLPEMPNSISFYDPDTLLFLDNVGGAESSTSGPASSITSESSLSLRSRGMTTPGIEDGEDGDELNPLERTTSPHYRHHTPTLPTPNSSSPKSEVSRKVRESLRQSKGDGSDRGMTLDVDLVEMLLSELDSTKNEMSELQSKYTAFRVSSFFLYHL
jgi:hypothetical protein